MRPVFAITPFLLGFADLAVDEAELARMEGDVADLPADAGTSPDETARLLRLARVETCHGRFAAAWGRQDQVRNARREADVERSAAFAEAGLDFALTLLVSGFIARARRELAAATSHRPGSGTLSERHVIYSRHIDAGSMSLRGRQSQALALQRWVVEKGTALLGPEDPFVWGSRCLLGGIQVSLGDYAEAAHIGLDLLARCEERFGSGSPPALVAASLLGAAYLGLDRFTQVPTYFSPRSRSEKPAAATS